MTSVLIVDRDPLLQEAARRQIEARGLVALIARSADEAVDLIAADGANLSGLIANIDLADMTSGWNVARLVREHVPEAAIGYLSSSGHRGWAVHGVPNSVLISTGGGAHAIPDSFFRLCRAAGGGDREPPADLAADRLARAVQRERELLYAHFQHTPSFIAFLGGADHRYTFVNNAYARLVERDVIGLTVVEAFPEAIAQGFVDILDRVYETGEEFIAHGIEFEVEIDNGPTKRTWLDLVYRPIRETDGTIAGVFVEGEDLTERQETQARVNALQNQLIHIARVNAMGLLSSTLAHELNQPLASIHNFMAAASIAASRQELDPLIIKCLDGASASALRAGGIVRRLRAMTVNGPIHKQMVAVEPALREAVATACTGRFDVEVGYDLGSTASVLVDQVQFQQVMLNLLQNAIEAANGAGPQLQVSTADDAGFVRICVRDFGSGISPDILPRIFESFATTKPEGMGIGLSLCRTIVEAHGGVMTAHDNEDAGATFCFTLPRAASG
jgi:two-component system sensor kinase FixL